MHPPTRGGEAEGKGYTSAMADGVVAGMLLATIVSLVSPSVVWSSHGGQMQEQTVYSGEHTPSIAIKNTDQRGPRHTVKRQAAVNGTILDTHTYYTSRYYGPGDASSSFWFELENRAGVSISDGFRLYSVEALLFSFPFYGHLINHVAVTTGGFLYTGEFYHPYVHVTQFIAPLQSNFNPSLNDTANILIYSTSQRFTVEWDKVYHQDHVEAGPFTFQVSLFPSGVIHFAYREAPSLIGRDIVSSVKDIPLDVTKINDETHPVEVGVADAFYIDEAVADPVLGSGILRIIYEYHRVQLNISTTLSHSAYVLTPLPNCVTAQSCSKCASLDATTDFECGWCSQRQRCSDGFDRYRQDWLESGCDSKSHLNCNGTALSKGAIAGIAIGGSAFLFIVLFLVLLIILLAYGYRKPESNIGQTMIKYRPKAWTLNRSAASYSVEGGKAAVLEEDEFEK